MSLPVPLVDEGDAYRVLIEHGEWPPSGTVPMAVARIEDLDPSTLTPLAEEVDPDALDELAGETGGDAVVTFTYEGYRVRVDDDGLRLDPAG